MADLGTFPTCARDMSSGGFCQKLTFGFSPVGLPEGPTLDRYLSFRFLITGGEADVVFDQRYRSRALFPHTL